MGLSRTARISLLLAIDICFFFVELIAGAYSLTDLLHSHSESTRSNLPLGYAVGSLALVADSFHMLKCVSVIYILDALTVTNPTTPLAAM